MNKVAMDFVAQSNQFDELFQHATIDKLLDLSWQQFQSFIEHVFAYSGYVVKDVSGQKWPYGSGFDLELYDPISHLLVSFVEVRRLTPYNHINFGEVAEFVGKLTLSRAAVPSFMVTTSDFTGPAKAAAAQHGNVFLMNGQRLLRFITYIGNSRLKDQNLQSDHPIFISPKALWDADQVTFRDPYQTTVMTVGNNKGGVGKTTTVVNLGFALARMDFRVLLVDFDSQASLTTTLPPVNDHSYPTVLDFFTHKSNLPEIVRQTRFPNVWLLPAHPDLKHLDTGASARPTDELYCASSLHADELLTPDGENFDWIIIDTPPAQTRYTRAALASSHYTLIPTIIETYGILGINQYLSTQKALQALMGKHVDIIGTFITKWKESQSTKKGLSNLRDVIQPSGIQILESRIPEDAKIEKAHLDTTHGMLRNVFGLTSPAARGYTNLMEEILSDDSYSTARH